GQSRGGRTRSHHQARAGLLPALTLRQAQGHPERSRGMSGVEGRRDLPLTLIADMVGAERAHAVLKDVMHQPGAVRSVGLFDALRDLAGPLYNGLTGP